MYTHVNKNPSAWNFLSPKPEMTCGTVAIIIRVVFYQLLHWKMQGETLKLAYRNLNRRKFSLLNAQINSSNKRLSILPDIHKPRIQQQSLCPFWCRTVRKRGLVFSFWHPCNSQDRFSILCYIHAHRKRDQCFLFDIHADRKRFI